MTEKSYGNRESSHWNRKSQGGIADSFRHSSNDHSPSQKNGFEKAILVGVCAGKTRLTEAQSHLEELERLADTAGAIAVERILQRTHQINPSTLVGSGKLKEIAELCELHCCQLVIFDDELSASQVRNIEKILGEVKVLDRTGLILDIFALHARTAESKLMVEIAQLEYTSGRLTRMWTHLSRQVAGVGMRGPGETQIELDRRIIKDRMAELRRKLSKIETIRDSQADRRQKAFHISVVGYTNAGKSTLTNALTNAGVYVANQLFATLDSTTRQLWLPEGQQAILSDTVGFIRKLPHNLVASFKSTLAVARQADLILHVVDASSNELKHHMEVTESVLKELLSVDEEEEEIPRQLVFNKCDLLDQNQLVQLRLDFPDAIFVSAGSKIGLEDLRKELVQRATLWDDQRRRKAAVQKPKVRTWEPALEMLNEEF